MRHKYYRVPALSVSLVTCVMWLLVSGQYSIANDCVDSMPIFDGKSLSGWYVKPSDAGQGDHWRVVAGTIIGENPNKKGSNLWTRREYANYELCLEYKSPSDYYDTGVFVRGESHQVQIGISGSLKQDMTACIYAPIDGAGSYPGHTNAGVIKEYNRVGEWNRLRILVTENRIQTFLNDQPMMDYSAAKLEATGPIGLQLHAKHHMKVLFRNIVIKEGRP